MLEKIPQVEIEKITLNENTILICYTDGLVELENSNNVAFETENLVKVVKNNFHLTMKDLDKAIFDRLNEFKGNQEFFDDTAVMSCKFFYR